MAREVQEYTTAELTVTFEPKLCIHAARCIMALPRVFRASERRWIQLENATTEQEVRAVLGCPSGALKFERLDGGPQEAAQDEPVIEPQRDGPLYIRGACEIRAEDGQVTRSVTRAALCRCGESQNKPFCDNTHRRIGFTTD